MNDVYKGIVLIPDDVIFQSTIIRYNADHGSLIQPPNTKPVVHFYHYEFHVIVSKRSPKFILHAILYVYPLIYLFIYE